MIASEAINNRLYSLIISNQTVGAAYAFAAGAHGGVGQVRKYTNAPYIVHPVEVASIVAGVEGATVSMVAAALLHDVLEDTKVEFGMLRAAFGDEIAAYVLHLTDYFTAERFPELNRKVRKEKEAQRYVFVPDAVKTIKLADGLSNTPSIAQHDPGFLKTYGPEKRALVERLRGGDELLWYNLDAQLRKVGY